MYRSINQKSRRLLGQTGYFRNYASITDEIKDDNVLISGLSPSETRPFVRTPELEMGVLRSPATALREAGLVRADSTASREMTYDG